MFDAFKTFSPTESKVRRLIEQVVERKVDPAPSYTEWFALGCSLKYEFGEGGRSYYHQVSQFHPEYNQQKCDQQFSSVKGKSEKPIKIASFFDILKVTGYILQPQRPTIMDDPEPMIPEAISVSKFPVGVFPSPIENFIHEASKSINCPVDYLGVAVLGVTSVALGRKYSISPKAGHREYAIFFMAVVGDPGQKKTPAYKQVMRPVFTKQKEYSIHYRKEMLAYEAEMEVWKEARKEDPGLERPVKPILHRILASDATMEALGTLLEENPIGLLLHYDELLAWINGCNQFKGKGNDHQKFLSLWSGTDIQIDRKQQEAKMINNPFVSITGGIQPDVLKDLSKGRNDGFLDRILFCFPDSIMPGYTRNHIGDLTEQFFEEKILHLFDRAVDDFDGNGNEGFHLKMSAEQFGVWIEWINNHHLETQAVGFPYYLKGSWTKMEAHSLRLILLLAYSRTQPDEKVEIRMGDIEGGIKLAEYFKTHIRKAYNEIHSSDDDRRILIAVDFIKRNGASITWRDMYRHRVAGCKSTKDVAKLFEEMESRSLGKTITLAATPGGKKSKVFQLDPSVI